MAGKCFNCGKNLPESKAYYLCEKCDREYCELCNIKSKGICPHCKHALSKIEE